MGTNKGKGSLACFRLCRALKKKGIFLYLNTQLRRQELFTNYQKRVVTKLSFLRKFAPQRLIKETKEFIPCAVRTVLTFYTSNLIKTI